jgi:hypothetical protein
MSDRKGTLNNVLYRIFQLVVIVSLVPGCTGCAKKTPAAGRDTTASRETVIPPGDARFPRIAVTGGKQSFNRVSYRFRFEDGTHKIAVRIDDRVYQGARETPKVALVPAEMEDVDISGPFQLALIGEAEQRSFYDELIKALRTVRDREGLDEDRYLELMMAFVQQIAYCDAHADNPKFPIETFVEKCGDCDDKSRLLAALLAEEGYEVALLLFPEEAHMAVGIRAPPLDYKGTGYGYVETTSPALVGFLADENTTRVRITSTPKVLPVGDGRKRYGKGREVAYLYKAFTEMKSCVAELKPEVEEKSNACREQEAALGELKVALDSTPRSRPDERSAAVKRYNGGVDRFNRLVTSRNEVAGELNGCAEVFNHILKNAFNRKGVHKWVRERLD